MLSRRILRSGVAICVLAVSILGFGSTANAAPSSFVSAAIHANGAGKLAVEATGNMVWGNRSVTLSSVKFYAAAGECGWFRVEGFQGGTLIDFKADFGERCGGTTGKWFTFDSFTLDGSNVSGGITLVQVDVFDKTHAGSGTVDCYRSAALCL
ncbi:hypothetical protein HDA40_004644 [Hamadaea flava]|uniref:Secreted protein n=1 Tax=Hamadaea flava TaxID=1742688 RepID=A0ABV8LEU6_9ACTN|nr:hypothetical protein [Hamadaea flava]MCP2326137.1 hypothetical protein [Hamadaea flava]